MSIRPVARALAGGSSRGRAGGAGHYAPTPQTGFVSAASLYLRWLQLGTFQPIMREHSDSGQNAWLPWEYDVARPAVRA
jgi:Glycosyl hydrolases family 31